MTGRETFTPTDEHPSEGPKASANGIVLKRTTNGYTWNIAVAAGGGSLEQMQAALEIADELVQTYGPITPRPAPYRR